ncbi:helix-turn-helix domain-containing protein [Chitinophaga sp. GCM10012297]|uniref:Winged helix-turn-helix domain-containing protein n=1 Tax=Chitinophaga chungangae TaxID=2821488 RepID=A0ABS3YB59_9BACT|nr:hypothetical protein [Chitinophaga chungangae]
MNLTTSSPINVEKLSRQNKMVYDHLMRGETITTLQAERLFGIRNLHSRIPELKNAGVVIYDRMVKHQDRFGELTKCKEYSLTEF